MTRRPAQTGSARPAPQGRGQSPGGQSWQTALDPLAHRVASWLLRRPQPGSCRCVLSTYPGPSREDPGPMPGSRCLRMWVIVTRIQLGLIQLPHDHLSDAQVPLVIEDLDRHLSTRRTATDALAFARDLQRILMRPVPAAAGAPTHPEGTP